MFIVFFFPRLLASLHLVISNDDEAYENYIWLLYIGVSCFGLVASEEKKLELVTDKGRNG